MAFFSHALGIYPNFIDVVHYWTNFIVITYRGLPSSSLETFAEVLSLVCCTLNELLSPGPEEELNFGTDSVENGLVIVRLISILIFTVHYVNREGESQSYADIVQRTVLLHNALAAVYELVGTLLKKCIQLHDPCSSYLLPGILVFVEWLASSPDVATCNDKDDKQATVRSVFWNHFIAFLNKLLSSELVVMDDDDETCFFNVSRYEEGETENRLALWEDFELRGFLPLQPAQTILEFSRKHFVRGDGNKEKIVRVRRFLAAGKALASVVTIDQKNMIFDSKEKKFVIGVNSQTSEDFTLTPYLGSPKLNDMSPQLPTETTKSSVIEQPKAFVEGEEEDEVIVFKPTVTEKRSELTVSKRVLPEALKPGKYVIAGNSHFPSGSALGRHRDLHQQIVFDATSQSPVSVASHVLPHLQSVYSHSSMWLDQQGSLANGLSGLSIMENGHVAKPGMQEDLPISHNDSFSLPTQQSTSVNASGTSYSQEKASEMMMQSKINPIASSGVTSGSLAVNMSALPASSKKGPVNRPVRHLGPPPGFSSVPPRQANGPISGSDLVADNLLPDDYSWLDGYSLPLTTKGSRPNQLTNHPLHSNPNHISKNDGFVGTTSFPFPGKQVLPKQYPVEKQNGWEDNHTLEHLTLQQQQLHLQLQQPMKGDQEFIPLPEQHQGKSLWGGRYPV